MKLLTKAIAFASRKHEGQKRKGTDIPYIVHPLEALSIASTLTNDENVLAAAVLHDVVEDTDMTLEALKEKFGSDVATLVDGVTKVTQMKFTSLEKQQAENH